MPPTSVTTARRVLDRRRIGGGATEWGDLCSHARGWYGLIAEPIRSAATGAGPVQLAPGTQVAGQRRGAAAEDAGSGRRGQQEALRLIGNEPAVNCHRGLVPRRQGLQGDVADSPWIPLPTRGASPSRRMTMVGSLRGVPVVDENSRPVEQAGLEVLQRLLCS